MDLGLMAIAGNGFIKGARDAERYDAEKQRTQADLSLLPDRTAAARSGYVLQNAQYQSKMNLLPSEEGLAKARNLFDTGELNGQIEAQPIQNETRLTKAKVARDTANYEHQDLPRKLAMAATKGLIDQQGQADVVLGTVGTLLARGDREGALDFSNRVAQTSDLLPNTNGMRFADVVEESKANGSSQDGYRFKLENGETKFVPVTTFREAMNKIKTGDYQFLHTPDGSVYSADKKTGRVTQQQKGTLGDSLAKQHSPAEVKTAEWLMANKVANNPTEAWNHVRSAKGKSRSAYIADAVANATHGKGGEFSQQELAALANNFGQVYDSINKDAPPGLGALPDAAVSDRIKQLIGIQ